jgi:hypothetical protein
MNLIQKAKTVLFNSNNFQDIANAEVLLQADENEFLVGNRSWANAASPTKKCLRKTELSTADQLKLYQGYSSKYEYFINPTALRVVQVPRWTTIHAFAARNTFSLFQQNSVLDLSWYGSKSNPITRQECKNLVAEMTAWVALPSSEAEAIAVGSDLGYVNELLEGIAKFLSKERFSHMDYVSFEALRDDNRETEALENMADAFADAYWSASPED